MKSKLPWYRAKFQQELLQLVTGTLPQLASFKLTSAGELAAGHNVGKRSERGNRLTYVLKTTFGQTTPNKGLFS